MIATWMLASTVVSVLFALAAFSIARVTALYRQVALRWIWASASLLSLGVALWWLTPAPRFITNVSVPRSSAVVERSHAAPLRTAVVHAEPGRMNRTERHLPSVVLPATPPSIDRSASILWLASTLGLIAVFASVALRLNRERREWKWHEVANTRVLVSPSFGPAVIGIAHQVIVVPEWMLTLDEQSQRAIIAHEEQHRAARDPALLLAGLAAAVLLPWNIGLWMSCRGLRRAIELDCDARVILHGIDAPHYARVLLNAWQKTHTSWLPSTAFAERVSGLGARVEHLMRPEPRGRMMKTLLGASVSAGLVALACAAPSPQHSTPIAAYPLVIIDGVKHPELPPRFRFTGAVVAETLTTPTYRISYRGPVEADTVAIKLYPSMDSVTVQQIDPPASIKHFGEEAKYGAVLYYTTKYRLGGGRMLAPGEGVQYAKKADPATPRAEMVQRNFATTFAGIALSPEQTTQALALIEHYFNEHSVPKRGPALVRLARFTEIEQKRNAGLRALLTSDADRERFDVRAAEFRPPHAFTLVDIENADYTNVLQRITLSADAQTKARSIIRGALNDELALYTRDPEKYDAYPIRLKRDAALRELLTTDADRTMFDRFSKMIRSNEFKKE